MSFTSCLFVMQGCVVAVIVSGNVRFASARYVLFSTSFVHLKFYFNCLTSRNASLFFGVLCNVIGAFCKQ